MDEHPIGAILQRDKTTYAIVPRTPVGIITPEHLERIASVARKFIVPVIKITSGQRFALVGGVTNAVSADHRTGESSWAGHRGTSNAGWL